MKGWKIFILYSLLILVFFTGCLFQNLPRIFESKVTKTDQSTTYTIGEASGLIIMPGNITWPIKIKVAIDEEKRHLIAGKTEICVNQEEKKQLIKILSNGIIKINAPVKPNSKTAFIGKILQGEDKGIRIYFVPGNKEKKSIVLFVLQENVIKRKLIYLEQNQIDQLIHLLGIGG